MSNRWTSAVLIGAVYGLAGAANAADEPLSYAADGKCFCNLSESTSIQKRIVGTPIGGQSVAQVCERIGDGPGLTGTSGSFNYPTFDDAQCGHGPGPAGFKGVLDDAGTGMSTGPKWDLSVAYGATSAPKITTTATSDASDSVDEKESTTTASSSNASKRFKPRYLKPTLTTETASVKEVAPKVEESSTNVVRVKPQISKPKAETPEAVATTEPAVVKKPVAVATPKPAPVKKPVAVASTKPAAPVAEKVEELPLAKTETIIETTESVTDEAVAEVKVVEPSTESTAVTETIATAPSKDAGLEALSNALRMPPSVRTSSREFEYFSILPVNYDFGGNGIQLSASKTANENVRMLFRIGIANDYQEGMVGASYLITPPSADRLTFALTAGVETGRFTLESGAVTTKVSDSGLFVRAKSRFVVNNRFELQGGVGHSGFFEGDPHAFGAALYHLTNQVDITGEFEVGDNDTFGIGVRYYY